MTSVRYSQSETEHLLEGLRQAEKQQPISYPQRAARRAWLLNLIRTQNTMSAAWQAGDCEDIQTPRVSEADDERNSRPFPF
jgi:GAF domain-containing protein